MVTYHPDVQKLRALLQAVRKQLLTIVIVDNTPLIDADKPSHVALLAQQYQVDLIELGGNLGIAVAQNRGVDFLITRSGLKYILFLDHDSLPGTGMVQALLSGFCEQHVAGTRVGAVGPQISLPKLQSAVPFIRLTYIWARRIYCTFPAEYIASDHLISSGTLISKQVLKDVGRFREDLFIDYVDVEWYLRAQQKGYTLWGICAAHMDHNLGDDSITVGSFQIFSHSPLRHYYLVRNAIALYASPQLPLRWKCSDAPRLLCKSIFYIIFGRSRLAHIRMMAKGLYDGLLGRMGPQQR